MFVKYSWYFRNALVRANYNDHNNNVYGARKFLMDFFGNLLLGEKNELKNRHLHINFDEDVGINVGINAQKVIDLITTNNCITAKEIAELLEISLRQSERILASLKERNLIERMGSNKSGYWKIVAH